MNRNDDQMDGMAEMMRSFLSKNPLLLDALVNMLHNIADDLDNIKDKRALLSGRYMQSHEFKQKIVEKMMHKLGYTISDIPEICNQGRADEILQEIDKMERSNEIIPSRRALPIASMRFKDVTHK